jgi:ubiquitin C-terminal hydrolase
MEDTLYLTLNIKDIFSVPEALQKLVDGEVINGYKCDGCKKTVDVSKRTLITETPNVLIVHL